MKFTPTWEGQAKYGKDFFNYNDLLLEHAVATLDPRGDLGHNGQHLLVYHKMFVLKFENSMLAVDPEILGVPYWDLRDDPYEAVFGSGELEFGSVVGTGELYDVVDGAFANWHVAPYNGTLIHDRGISWLFDQTFSNATGRILLRKSDILTTRIVRYPVCSDEAGPVAYSQEDYDVCNKEQKWADFYWCHESPPLNAPHEFTHLWVASIASDMEGFLCPEFNKASVYSGYNLGDYIDKATSPNDPIFMLHHSFVDLNTQEWMRKYPEHASDYWGYQASKQIFLDDNPPDSTLLYDIINDHWPFLGEDMFDQPDAPTGPVKHWEAICWSGAYTARYTYDIFEDDILCTDDETEIEAKASRLRN